MRRFDLIISDIDGCLGPESHAPMDARALLRVAEHNLLATTRADRPALTLCSGRPQPYAEALCRVLANTVAPVICEMGVWLYDPRDNRFLLDPRITPAHRAMVSACTQWLEQELIPQGVVIQPGKTASISLWHPDTAFLMQQKPRIRERCEKSGWDFRVSNTVAWINLELSHVSKGTGIDRLTAMLGHPRERLAGIGDTAGDLAIRERVAFFACPANASDELKHAADYVSPFREIEGVLDILERLR